MSSDCAFETEAFRTIQPPIAENRTFGGVGGAVAQSPVLDPIFRESRIWRKLPRLDMVLRMYSDLKSHAQDSFCSTQST